MQPYTIGESEGNEVTIYFPDVPDGFKNVLEIGLSNMDYPEEGDEPYVNMFWSHWSEGED